MNICLGRASWRRLDQSTTWRRCWYPWHTTTTIEFNFLFAAAIVTTPLNFLSDTLFLL
ncbi:hypothetical protein BDR03DRAFT_968401 [Suillus americanus]|nr:hypothetical protein BDR03DRAFT_968401 [Suillus americanus]